MSISSSRIFVRGLPPKLSQEEFRKHFSSQHAVTDAKLIPHRRIGYVGYKSPEDAAKAVKYFNKSYIRMSRILVELAHAIGDGSVQPAVKFRHSQLTPKNGDSVVPPLNTTSSKLGDENHRKRNRDAVEADGGGPELQEFLEVMQGSSKSKTWANQDPRATGTNNLKFKEARNGSVKVPSREDVELMPPAKKLHSKATHQSVIEAGNDHQTGIKIPQPLEDGAQNPPAERSVVAPEEQAITADHPFVAASDSDWLRSKTSRVLGLVDEDEDRGAADALDSGEQATSVNGEPNPQLSPVKDTDMIEDAIPNEKEAQAREGPPSEDPYISSIKGNGRLFLRNLSYTASENDLRQYLSSHGQLAEVHLALDSKGSSKGFAFISYSDPECAIRAYKQLDGKPFQGRLLHVIPASSKANKIPNDYDLAKLPLKTQKQIKSKATAASSTFNWNSLYMSTDAVMSSIAERLNIAKADLLNPTSSNAAVKQAHAETHVIQETKAFFASKGVDLEAFERRERGDTVILVKNFPYATKAEEIRILFETFGPVVRVLMPPAGTIALVEFAQAPQARAAFGSLAYRRFKDSILFLEKAPKGIFKYGAEGTSEDAAIPSAVEPKLSTNEILQPAGKEEIVDTNTLFVKNLNFSTTTNRLTEVCKPLTGFLSARVKTKPDPRHPGQTLSMGFGFLEFETRLQAEKAAATLDSYNLDGHKLVVRAAQRTVDAAEETRKKDKAKKASGRKTKIVIKNLPFEASKKEVRSLLGSYGQLRSVRVPKKFDSSARGFAFAEFVTAREAENAMTALKNTHLLGRRLVIDYAAEDAVDAETEIQKMQEKVGRQINRVNLQRLMSGGRKKLNIEGEAPEE